MVHIEAAFTGTCWFPNAHWVVDRTLSSSNRPLVWPSWTLLSKFVHESVWTSLMKKNGQIIWSNTYPIFSVAEWAMVFGIVFSFDYYFGYTFLIRSQFFDAFWAKDQFNALYLTVTAIRNSFFLKRVNIKFRYNEDGFVDHSDVSIVVFFTLPIKID